MKGYKREVVKWGTHITVSTVLQMSSGGDDGKG